MEAPTTVDALGLVVDPSSAEEEGDSSDDISSNESEVDSAEEKTGSAALCPESNVLQQKRALSPSSEDDDGHKRWLKDSPDSPPDSSGSGKNNNERIFITIKNENMASRRTFSFTNGDSVVFEKTRPNGVLPTRSTGGSVGFDLYTPVPLYFAPGQIFTVMTNIRIAQFPKNSYMRIAGRSGLASTMGLVPHGGVIDPDYTGVLCIILQNMGYKTINIRADSSIAQGIFESVLMPELDPHLEERGRRGLGRPDIIIPSKLQDHF